MDESVPAALSPAPAAIRAKRRRHRHRPAYQWIAALVALNLAWRTVRYLLNFPMWGDEAFVAVNFFDRGFADMLRPLDHYQIVPVGFMWLNLAAARLLGTGEMALRLTPFIAGLASMPLMAMMASRVLGRRAALLAVAIFAASYYPVRHAAEVKPYSMDLLAGVTVLILAWRVHERPASVLRWLTFAFVCAAAVWCSYPVVFVAGGAYSVLACDAWTHRRRPAALAPWLLGGLTLGASFATMYATVGAAQAADGAVLYESSTWREFFPPLREPWRLPWWLLETHAGNLLAYPVGGRNFGSAATLIMVIAGGIALWRSRRRALLMLLISPFILMFIAAALGMYPYGGSARTNQHIAPAVCLLAGVGLLAIFRGLWAPRIAFHAARIAAVAMAVIIVAGMIADVASPTKRTSDALAREFARDFGQRAGPGDRLVIFGALGEHDLAPDFLNLGGSAARLRYDLQRYGRTDLEWATAPSSLIADAEAARQPMTIWILAYHDNDAPFPRKKFNAWRAPLVKRFGPPDVERHDLGHRLEAVELHRFRIEPAP